MFQENSRGMSIEWQRRMIKSVIFDLDGTLVDSVDAHALAWQESFKYFGKDIPFEQVRAQIGKGGDQLLPVFFNKLELEAFGDELSDYRKQHFRHNYLPNLKPFPMVRELFERVREDGKQIIIASSSNEDDLKALKHIAGIEDLVDETVSADDADSSKPEPDIFLAALKKSSTDDKHSVITIGDSPYDSIAAKRAGLASIGVLSGGFLEIDLRANGCLAIYRDPADLLERYDSSIITTGQAVTST
jgi:HAD superfamily hydrolase (TIGR01509 family)